MPRLRVASRLLGLLVGGGLILTQASLTAHAASTDTWTGSGADAKWSTAANWSGGQAPVSGDDIVFPTGATRKVATNDIAGLALHSITVNDRGYSLNGVGVRMDDGSISGSSPVTFNMPVTVTSGHALALSGNQVKLTALQGIGTVNIIGSGEVFVTGPHSTFSGQLVQSSDQEYFFYASASGRPSLTATLGTVFFKGTLGQVNLSAPASGFFVGGWGTTPGIADVTGLSAARPAGSNPMVLSFPFTGLTPGSGYSQLVVRPGGVVSIDGTLLDITGCAATAPGDRLTAIRHLGGDPIVGTFDALPEGAEWDVCGTPFSTTYRGGPRANDLVLERMTSTIGAVASSGQVLVGQRNSLAADGGALRGAPALLRPATYFPGRDLQVYGVGSDGTLWDRSMQFDWHPLTTGGPILCTDNPAVAQEAMPDMYTDPPGMIACTGTDGALRFADLPPYNGGGLPQTIPASAWKSAGGVLTAGPAVGYVGGATTPTFFGVGQDQNIWTATPTSGFVQAPWRCTGHPSVSTQDSTTYFACHGTDGALWYDIYSGGHWRGAQSLGGNLIDGTAVVATRTGATFYVEGTDHQVWETSVTNGAQTPWLADGGYVDRGVGASA